MLEKGSAWAEASQKELVINLEEQEHEHFKKILEYMYTGSTDFIDSRYKNLCSSLQSIKPSFQGMLCRWSHWVIIMASTRWRRYKGRLDKIEFALTLLI